MPINRRRFLRNLGLGGAGMCLMGPAIQSVLRADAGTPRRFVIFVQGNGIEPRALTTDAMERALIAAGSPVAGLRYPRRMYEHSATLVERTPQLSRAPSLGPLAASRGSTSLEEKAAVVLGLSNRIAGGGHSAEAGALGCTQRQEGRPLGITIDALLARLPAVRRDTPFDAVRLGIGAHDARVMYAPCAYGPGRLAPILGDPTDAFYELFGSVAEGTGRGAFEDRRDLLDFARRDIDRSLAAFSGSSAERGKLEAYLQSVETLAARQDSLDARSAELRTLLPPAPARSRLYDSADPLERLDLHGKLATAALVGGLTNVVVISQGGGDAYFNIVYPSIMERVGSSHGVHPDISAHSFRHRLRGGQELPDYYTLLTERNVQILADLARALEAVPEAGHEGTMLDHTAILMISDNGDEHHAYDWGEWPMLLLGGRKLGMLTDGRAVMVPGREQAQHRQVSNVFNTLGYAAGAELDEFGAEGRTRIAAGPLEGALWAPTS